MTLTPAAQKFVLHWGEMGQAWGINRTMAQVHALLFVAPTERQVFILPDSGVAAVIDATAWRAIIDRLVAGRPARFPVEALAGAVADILALLECHFPRDEVSTSALPDDVIELPRGS